jgi:hypothetical protein
VRGREGEFLSRLRCGVRWEDEEAETRRLGTAGRRLVESPNLLVLFYLLFVSDIAASDFPSCELPRAGLWLLTVFCNGLLLARQPFLSNNRFLLSFSVSVLLVIPFF